MTYLEVIWYGSTMLLGVREIQLLVYVQWWIMDQYPRGKFIKKWTKRICQNPHPIPEPSWAVRVPIFIRNEIRNIHHGVPKTLILWDINMSPSCRAELGRGNGRKESAHILHPTYIASFKMKERMCTIAIDALAQTWLRNTECKQKERTCVCAHSCMNASSCNGRKEY